jgi:hypothetical protein
MRWSCSHACDRRLPRQRWWSSLPPPATSLPQLATKSPWPLGRGQAVTTLPTLATSTMPCTGRTRWPWQKNFFHFFYIDMWGLSQGKNLVIPTKMPLCGSVATSLAKRFPCRSKVDLRSVVELIRGESDLDSHFPVVNLYQIGPYNGA